MIREFKIGIKTKCNFMILKSETEHAFQWIFEKLKVWMLGDTMFAEFPRLLSNDGVCGGVHFGRTMGR